MKSTIKIFGVMLGLALAMTAAYARSEDRSEPPQAQRDAAAVVSRTSQIVIPAALRPPTLTCKGIGAECVSPAVCAAAGGFVVTIALGCINGNVCCEF
ncbi:MAG TPA: hypothetical protein VF516_48180 [Kofleriaceae bacterium]